MIPTMHIEKSKLAKRRIQKLAKPINTMTGCMNTEPCRIDISKKRLK